MRRIVETALTIAQMFVIAGSSHAVHGVSRFRQERGDARFMAAAFTAMMLMAVAMVGVWVAFRDFVYLGYGAYLGCMATYLLLLSGDASEMWGLASLASEPAVGWALANSVSYTACAPWDS